MQLSSETVILLNGASSAGKSSIARELQSQLDTAFLHVGIDHFMSMLPARYFGAGPPFTTAAMEGFRWVRPPAGEDARGVVIAAGPLAQQLIASYHRTVASMATAGISVIVDDVLLEPGWLDDWLTVLDGIPTLMVGVHCPLAENERRELARGDREPGQARGQFNVVHAHGEYDLEVNSSLLTAAECAAEIVQQLDLASDETGNAFARLRRLRHPPRP